MPAQVWNTACREVPAQQVAGNASYGWNTALMIYGFMVNRYCLQNPLVVDNLFCDC